MKQRLDQKALLRWYFSDNCPEKRNKANTDVSLVFEQLPADDRARAADQLQLKFPTQLEDLNKMNSEDLIRSVNTHLLLSIKTPETDEARQSFNQEIQQTRDNVAVRAVLDATTAVPIFFINLS